MPILKIAYELLSKARLMLEMKRASDIHRLCVNRCHCINAETNLKSLPKTIVIFERQSKNHLFAGTRSNIGDKPEEPKGDPEVFLCRKLFPKNARGCRRDLLTESWVLPMDPTHEIDGSFAVRKQNRRLCLATHSLA